MALNKKAHACPNCGFKGNSAREMETRYYPLYDGTNKITIATKQTWVEEQESEWAGFKEKSAAIIKGAAMLKENLKYDYEEIKESVSALERAQAQAQRNEEVLLAYEEEHKALLNKEAKETKEKKKGA